MIKHHPHTTHPSHFNPPTPLASDLNPSTYPSHFNPSTHPSHFNPPTPLASHLNPSYPHPHFWSLLHTQSGSQACVVDWGVRLVHIIFNNISVLFCLFWGYYRIYRSHTVLQSPLKWSPPLSTHLLYTNFNVVTSCIDCFPPVPS